MARRRVRLTVGPTPELAALHPPLPVSQTAMWEVQREFYAQLGVTAWDERTPYFITNSRVTAQVYAELIIAMLLDHQPELDDGCLTILELGTGVGRLGFYLARELERQQAYFAATRDLRFRVILSDLPEETLKFWQQHPGLEHPYLDFARFDPLADDGLRLLRSGAELAAGSLRGPLVVLANYTFDSLPHDEFQIRFGRLDECRMQFYRVADPTHSTPERTDIRDLVWTRSYHRLDTLDYYPDPELNAHLRYYAERVKFGAFTLPLSALSILKRVQTLARGGMMLLASDRGFTTVDQMTRHMQHPYDIHHGCFSHFVNFDAIGRFFTAQQGSYRHTTHHGLFGVQTICGLTLSGPGERLDYAFHEHLDRPNRINGASQTLSLGRVDPTPLEAGRALMDLMSQNLCDPNAVVACGRRLMDAIGQLPLEERQDLIQQIEQAWTNFYYFKGAVNLPFWLAQLCLTLDLPEPALFYFERTIELFGEDAYLNLFKAGCLDRLGRPEEAAAAHQRARELDPSVDLAESILAAGVQSQVT